MQVYCIVSSTEGRIPPYYVGATEATKQARELSKQDEAEFSVFEFTTPKTYIDKETFLLVLNEEPWCKPVVIATFVAGRAKK